TGTFRDMFIPWTAVAAQLFVRYRSVPTTVPPSVLKMNPFCPRNQNATDPRGTLASRISRIKLMRSLWQTLGDAECTDGLHPRRPGAVVFVFRPYGRPR